MRQRVSARWKSARDETWFLSAQMKTILGNLAAILVGVIAACILAEIGLRVFGPPNPHFFIYDSERGWILRPGAAGWQREEGAAFIRINRDGMRDVDHTIAKPPRTIRIAVIGDSFTEAQEVPAKQAYWSVMQDQLASCPAMAGRRAEALDFGIDGYGTAQEIMTLDRRGWKYEPDFVVLEFFNGNDFRNNTVALEGDKCRPFYVERGGELVAGGPFDESESFRLNCAARFYSRYSRLLNLLGQSHRIIKSLRARENPPPMEHEAGLSDSIFTPPKNADWRDAWQVSDDLLLKLNRDVAAHGARLLVVVVGSPIEVNPNPEVLSRMSARLGVKDLFYADHRLQDFASAHGIDMLDLSEPMRAYAIEHQVYFHGFPNTKMGTGHWNARGHEFAGKMIAQALCGMIAPAPNQTTHR